MDKQVPTWCAQHRMDPDDATLVLNGIPFCNTDECRRKECLRLAERQARYSSQKEGAFNGA